MEAARTIWDPTGTRRVGRLPVRSVVGAQDFDGGSTAGSQLQGSQHPTVRPENGMGPEEPVSFSAAGGAAGRSIPGVQDSFLRLHHCAVPVITLDFEERHNGLSS